MYDTIKQSRKQKLQYEAVTKKKTIPKKKL